MFDFSFSEVALIGVVALVVIGPERLPRVARTAGVMVNRAQRYASSVRAEIEREVDLSEMRRVQSDLQGAAQAFQSDVRTSLAAAEAEFAQNRAAVMQGPLPGAEHPHVLPAPAPAPAPALAPAREAGAAPLHGMAAASASLAVPVEPALPDHARANPHAGTPQGDDAGSLMGWQRMLGPSAAARGPRSTDLRA